jgi:hypothetical protein
MEYVYRSAGIVRGLHSYAVVVDDLKENREAHLYQWTAMLGSGVWQAKVDGLGPNQIVLAAAAPVSKIVAGKTPIIPKPGDPLLLATVLAPGVILATETVDEPGEGLYDRFTASIRAVKANFRVVLVPYRSGEPLPVVKENAISWSDQQDDFQFTSGADGRARFSIGRSGKVLAEIR